jgi:hypothetical protein
MSGAQGAQPKGAFTATTYRSALAGSGGQESRQTPRTELRSGEDEPGLPVRKLEDKVDDGAGVRRRQGGGQA